MSMIESERAGPPAPGSLLSGGRASEPSTRIVLPREQRCRRGVSAASALSELCSANCAETKKTTTESRIQPSTASTTHLTTRPHEIGLRVRRRLAAGARGAGREMPPGSLALEAAERALARAVDVVFGLVGHRVCIPSADEAPGDRARRRGHEAARGRGRRGRRGVPLARVRTWPRSRTREEVLLTRSRTAVEEARAARPARSTRSAWGCRRRWTSAPGVAVGSGTCRSRDSPFRDWLADETGLPVFVDNDATLALLAEQRRGRGAGRARRRDADDRDRDRRRDHQRRPARARRARRGGRAGPHDDRRRRPAVPGRLSRPRLPGGVRVRSGAGADGLRVRGARAATTTSAACWPSSGELTGGRRGPRGARRRPGRARGARSAWARSSASGSRACSTCSIPRWS